MGACVRLASVAVATVIGLGGWAAPAGAFVYWANEQTGTIGRANLDGSGVTQGFITGASLPIGVAVDGQHIYWANNNSSMIGRANLDGSGVNHGFITGASIPTGVAVDGQHVYWTNENTGTVGRANLDGSGADQGFITGASAPVMMAVDGRYVYWANQDSIGRANLDGSGAEQGFISASRPGGVAVDGQHVYWTNSDADTIGRANLDGSGAEQNFITDASTPVGVTIDGQHVYWTNAGTNAIGRANLDGSGADQKFIIGASVPVGVAVDGGPAGSASASATSLAFGTQPLGVFGAPRALTITNSGHGNLQIDTARIAGGAVDDFLVSYDSCSHSTLTIGAACTIHARFGPSAMGARNATLALTSNDTASPLQIQLTGTAGPLPQGPAGPKGSAGATGPAGPQGPTGRRGRPGRVRLVTCRTVTVRRHGHRVKRRRCKTRLIRGTATFTIPARARASLTRHHVLYATGTARHARLVLHARRRLPAGRYTLTLHYRHHGHRITTRTPITLG